MGRFAMWPWADRRQPVTLVPACAPPQMGKLNHHGTAMFMTSVCEVANPRHNFILIGQNIIKNWWAVTANCSGSGSHSQSHATARALCMIRAIAAFRHPVFGIGGFMAGCHDPVFQYQVLQLERLQKWIRHTAVMHWRFPCPRLESLISLL